MQKYSYLGKYFYACFMHKKKAFYAEYYRTLAKCGCRKIRPYSCRHTTATALSVNQQAAPSVIAAVMRQQDQKTQERYIHAELADAHAAVNGLHVDNGVDSR